MISRPQRPQAPWLCQFAVRAEATMGWTAARPRAEKAALTG